MVVSCLLLISFLAYPLIYRITVAAQHRTLTDLPNQ